MSEALQKEAAFVYTGFLIARANRPAMHGGEDYIREWPTLSPANA